MIPYGKSMSKTGIFMIIIVFAIAIYDLFAFMSGGVASTISRYLEGSFDRYPAILLAFVYFLGHIISPMKCQKCLARELEDKKNDST